MKPVRLLPSLAVLLLASACGGGSNELANTEPTANDMAFENMIADDQLADNALGEEEAADEVAVAPPPAPASGLSAEEAAPLAQATQVASQIAEDATVERVRYQDGWAWRRGGQIIRTASRDGRRVSYFRPGESVPFFVQDDDRGFAYAGGRPQRVYDRRGVPRRSTRPAAPRPSARPRRRAARARRPGARRRDPSAKRIRPATIVRPGIAPGATSAATGMATTATARRPPSAISRRLARGPIAPARIAARATTIGAGGATGTATATRRHPAPKGRR